MISLFFNSIILIVAVVWIIRTFLSGSDWRLAGPWGVLMLCFIFYCAVGPIVLSSVSELDFMGIDLRSGQFSASLTSFVAFACCWIGYLSRRASGHFALNPLHFSGAGALTVSIWVYGFFWICVLASYSFAIPTAYNVFGSANLLDGAEAWGAGGFSVYFYNMMSSLVAPIVIITAAWRGGVRYWLVWGFMFVNLGMLIVATGFRLRVAFMIICVVSAFYLVQRSRINWAKSGKWFTVVKVALVFALGGGLLVIMSAARQYGKGLDLDRVEQATGSDFFVSTLGDANIYFVGGLVVDFVDNVYGYTYFDSYKSALLRAIPQAFIGEKALPKTIQVISMTMGGGNDAISAGFAVPYYTENYMSFGWVGLVLGSLLLGRFCSFMERWVLTDGLPIKRVFYILTTGFIFIYFHRGYFPQQLDYFMFMVVLPCVLFWFINRSFPFCGVVYNNAFQARPRNMGPRSIR